MLSSSCFVHVMGAVMWLGADWVFQLSIERAVATDNIESSSAAGRARARFLPPSRDQRRARRWPVLVGRGGCRRGVRRG